MITFWAKAARAELARNKKMVATRKSKDKLQPSQTLEKKAES